MNQEEKSRTGASNQHQDHHHHPHHPPPKFAVEDKVYGVQHQHYDPPAPASKEERSSSSSTVRRRRSSCCYYEAVVRQSRFDFSSGTWLYLIHYLGWNHRWDEWMDVTQLLTPSEYQQLDDQHDEKQSQQENSNNHSAESAEYYDHDADRATRSLLTVETTPTTAGTTAVALASSNASNNNYGNTAPATATNTTGNKRHRMNDPTPPPASNISTARKRARMLRRTSNRPATSDGASVWTYAEYCELPLTLQTVLVEEQERLTTTTNLRWVHSLPATVPVSKVLHHFAKKKCKELWKQEQQQSLENTNSSSKTNPALTPEGVQAFVESLAQLFNEALSTCLLYPQERPQYEAWLLRQQQKQPNNGTTSSPSPVDCYGCEYLLRLLVRLPVLLLRHPTTTPSQQQQQHRVGGPLLTELIVLMQKNRSALFAATTNYRRPEPPHERGEQSSGPPRLENMMDTTH